jgi:hypothetical protein
MNGTIVFSSIQQHLLDESHSHLQVLSFNLSQLFLQSSCVLEHSQPVPAEFTF